MIQSMTGYGEAQVELPSKKITVEIRCVNSKYLDLNIKLPACFKAKEMMIRKQLGEQLKRGKIEFFLRQQLLKSEKNQVINKAIVRHYIDLFKEIVPTENEVELLAIAMQMRDTVIADQEQIQEEDWNIIQKTINGAAEDLIAFRVNEGKSLEQDLKLRISVIGELLKSIEPLEKQRTDKLKTYLREKIDHHLDKDQIDKNRFEQELIFYFEKLDITEEKVRLQAHLNYFLEQLNHSESRGKKLGFISQEIGREINTLGAKVNHAAIQKTVVQMKDELEKIKEQILNIL